MPELVFELYLPFSTYCAGEQLAEHYSPHRPRFDLLMTLLKRLSDTDSMDSYVSQVCYRHLQ